MNPKYRLEESVGYLVNLAARLAVRALERRLAGGSSGPMPVFIALFRGGTLSQSALARWASVEQPTMANTLNRMERDGLIERTPDPSDGRSALVALTELGRQRANEALTSGLDVTELALSDLDPAEREAFYALLQRVIRNLEADGEESGPPQSQ